MIIRTVLTAAVMAAAMAASVTGVRSQTPPRAPTSGVGTIRVQPDVVPPLRSFRVQPEDTPALPAARPVEEDANVSPAAAPRAEPAPGRHEQIFAATAHRHQRGGADFQARGRRSRHTRRSEADPSDRDFARATSDPAPAGARTAPSLSRPQREAVVAAILRDGKGVVPDASAPFPVYPVGAKVAQFSLMISPLPPGAIARQPQLGAYGYLVVHNRVLLVDPRTVTIVAELAG
jgi:hypothetical protein